MGNLFSFRLIPACPPLTQLWIGVRIGVARLVPGKARLRNADVEHAQHRITPAEMRDVELIERRATFRFVP